MTNPSRRKGSQYEVDLVKALRGVGLDAERLRLSGRLDEGDVVVKIGGVPFVVECKATRSHELGPWVNQARVEAGHYAAARGIEIPHFFVAAKRRQQPILESFAITPLWQLLEMVRPPL